jgi:hypothetical protein
MHRQQEFCSQRLATSRLIPIRAAREATNLMVAHVNVGADRGEKSDAVTSVWCMMNTFKQFSWFGEMSEEIRAVVPRGERLSGRFTCRWL